MNVTSGYLQVSGFQLQYDLTRPRGGRLVSAMVRCGSDTAEAGECDEAGYRDLEDEEVISIIST